MKRVILALALLVGGYYLPIRTRPWMLVAVIVVLAATAIAYPTASLLIAQAAAIGIVLAPLSMFLARWVSGPSGAIRREIARDQNAQSRPS